MGRVCRQGIRERKGGEIRGRRMGGIWGKRSVFLEGKGNGSD